jgi:hypothetical protein
MRCVQPFMVPNAQHHLKLDPGRDVRVHASDRIRELIGYFADDVFVWR